jgi:hypothetical protein
MVEGNPKEEEQRGATLKERIFIDLTVEEEEVVKEADRVATEQGSVRDQLYSESEESLLMEVSSNDELEVSNMNDDGMNNDDDLLMNSGGKIVGP